MVKGIELLSEICTIVNSGIFKCPAGGFDVDGIEVFGVRKRLINADLMFLFRELGDII